MIRLEYWAWSSPWALGMLWILAGTNTTPLWVAVICGALVVLTSTWPGLVDPKYKGRLSPVAAFAWLIRSTAHLGHLLRPPVDRNRLDLTRGPTYCVEWCLLAGLVVALLLLKIPFIAGQAWWFGLAVTIGTVSHFLTDLPTPTGVPVSAVYNWAAHGDLWRRHSLGWFPSDDTADGKFYAVPALFFVDVLMGLAMVGWLVPITSWLCGQVCHP